MGGWIKLHRKMRQWKFYRCPSVRLVFEELLFCASPNETWFHGERIQRGETVVSVHKLCELTGYSTSVVVDALKKLCDNGEIKRERCWRGIKTTVVGYARYQDISISENETLSENESVSKNESVSEKSILVSISESETTKEVYIKNNIDVDLRAHEKIEQLRIEVMGDIRMEQACMTLSITKETYKKIAAEIIADWIFTNEPDVNLKHFLNTMRRKVLDYKERANEDNTTQPKDKRRGSDTAATRTQDYDGAF